VKPQPWWSMKPGPARDAAKAAAALIELESPPAKQRETIDDIRNRVLALCEQAEQQTKDRPRRENNGLDTR
jgi:hypothetical protein